MGRAHGFVNEDQNAEDEDEDCGDGEEMQIGG